MSMESLYLIYTRGVNPPVIFASDVPFRSYSPLRVITPTFLLHIEGLGFEPRTLGFEAQVVATLATEARLVSSSDTLYLFLS